MDVEDFITVDLTVNLQLECSYQSVRTFRTLPINLEVRASQNIGILHETHGGEHAPVGLQT